MASSRVNRAKRKAAGHVCLTLFSAAGSLAHGVRTVAERPSGVGPGLGQGLTDKEREYVRGIASDMHDIAIKLKDLGWRFHGSSR